MAATTTAAPYSSLASVFTAQAQQMIEVQAGGGNATATLNQFIPQKVEINTGQSITWVNPTTIGEPHTVTFVLDNRTMTGVVSHWLFQIQHNLHLYLLVLIISQL